jgi:hypothetical protein
MAATRDQRPRGRDMERGLFACRVCTRECFELARLLARRGVVSGVAVAGEME